MRYQKKNQLCQNSVGEHSQENKVRVSNYIQSITQWGERRQKAQNIQNYLKTNTFNLQIFYFACQMHLLQKIEAIQMELKELRESATLLDLCKKTRIICSKIVYIKSLVKSTANYSIGSTLQNSLIYALDISESLQSSSHDLILPLLASITKNKKRAVSTLDLTINRAKRELSIQFGVNMPAFYLKYHPSSLNHYFNQITKNQVVMQSNSCICCSEVFIKNQKVQNHNQKYIQIMEMSAQTSFDMILFKKCISALCNKGGGVILFGVIRSQNNLIIQGIKFHQEAFVFKKHQQIMKAFLSIGPSFHSSDFFQEPASDQFLRFCFRVQVFSNCPGKLTYVEYESKGCFTVYEAFDINSDGEVFQIAPSQIYSKMNQNFKIKNFRESSHKLISCFRTYNYYSKKFYELLNKKIVTHNSVTKSTKKQIKVQNKFDLKFKYKNTSLLIVGSAKSDKQVQELQNRLKQCKKSIQLIKPFKSYFAPSGGRSIWMLSHEMSFSQLKGFILNCEIQCIIREGSIKSMSVENVLQIERQKLSYYNENILQQKFKQKCNKKILTMLNRNMTEKGEHIQFLSFQFDGYSQSIFGFLIFEQMKLRAHYIKHVMFLKEIEANQSGSL